MLAFKTTFALLALGFAGCSSSSTREPFPLKEDNTDTRVPAFGTSTPAAQPPSEPPAPAPTTTATQKKDEQPAPANKPPECPTEKEPNNDPDKATEFKRCITGSLSGWTDNDYLRIKAPQNVTDMIIDHMDPQGGINYTVTAGQGGNGANSNFNMSFTDDAPQTKITPGMTYLFQLKWDNNGAGAVTDSRTYMIRVTFQ